MNEDSLKLSQLDARAAGLRYVGDAEPGIQRVGAPPFKYVNAAGKRVRDAATLARIRALVIPPAWEHVWICKDDRGHIQCTGRDAKGRKQYKYHARWRDERDANKYGRVLGLGRAMKRIRAAVERDLALPGLTREKVLATVMRLLELTCMRVGNEEYALKNKSFGLTTLRNRHVDVVGAEIKLRFRGKSGKVHAVDVHDARLAKVVRRCEELPGQHLFEYLDSEGELHTVESHDVNDYLRVASGGDFTAKDYRTLAGTVLAARFLREAPRGETRAALKRTVDDAIKHVAAKLGNTVSVCRKCYVHPGIIDAFMRTPLDGGAGDLHDEEAAILRLVQRNVLPELELSKRAS